jgi:hypothetical protein
MKLTVHDRMGNDILLATKHLKSAVNSATVEVSRGGELPLTIVLPYNAPLDAPHSLVEERLLPF